MTNINRLTLGEMAKVEELSGQSLSALGDESMPKGKTLAALVFVMKKREEPLFTFEQALNLTADEAMEFLGLADDEDEDPKAKD